MRARQRPADRAFRAGATSAGSLILVILAAVAIFLIAQSVPALLVDPSEIKGSPASFWAYVGPLVFGTVWAAALALILAVPVAVGIALFISHYAPRRLAQGLGYIVDLLAAVPSVVFGLWGIRILAPKLDHVFGNGFFRFLGDIPVIGNLFGDSSGRGFMTAGIVVALMITPIITSVTREVFVTVPRNDKEGALALGATRWEMIRGVVLPHSTGGITGAVMLGLGRALGETIAVALLIGANPQVSANLLGTGETIPAQIARQLSEASGLFRSALIGLGFVLFLITIAVNVTARRLVVVMDRRLKGA
jgi:phosphate transport system permease protein